MRCAMPCTARRMSSLLKRASPSAWAGSSPTMSTSRSVIFPVRPVCIPPSRASADARSRAPHCIDCSGKRSCSPGKAPISWTSTSAWSDAKSIRRASAAAPDRLPKTSFGSLPNPAASPPNERQTMNDHVATLAPADAVQKLKYYQKGTFTVGNRLIAEDRRAVQASQDRSNALTCGHRACQGCGEALGARYAIDAAMRATRNNLIAVNATGCLEVFTTPYPETSWQLPWLHSLFRNDAVLYICYDNEGYMNTGVQRSSATPPTARTATTPALGTEPGNVFGTGKSVPKIAVAHNIPYVATATVADLHDLERKVIKAMSIHGARYIQINVPCPLGWGSASHDTIRLAQLAVECGLYPIFEAEHGKVTRARKIRKKVPVQDYLKRQRRFAHLFRGEQEDPRVTRLQAMCDANISEYGLLDAVTDERED